MAYKSFVNHLDNETNIKTVVSFNTLFPIFDKKYKINIDNKINSIEDILDITHKYQVIENVEYNIDLEILHKIKGPLQKLSSMIGILDIKNNIIEQILYYLQGLHNNNDYLHTIICGPPGTGKTEISKIIGEIFMKIGILKNDKFMKVTRSDLIGGFLGQTAIKTKKVIEECLGGVLFIDEVYSLGNSDKSDSFSKECIDTLCEALSNHKNNIMVIVAGYENEIKNCFFNYNEGLESRFIWKYKIDKYNANELYLILVKKINEIKWSLSDEITETWFVDKVETFKYYGRDIELLVSKIKIAHAKRIFGIENVRKKLITLDDLDRGFKKVNKREAHDNKVSYVNMYT
jgi:SpoVK/Ycf46/Vps4 family AAA+-type ATPase